MSATFLKCFSSPDPIAYIGDGEHVFVQRRRRRRGVDETSQEIIVFPGESRARDEPNGRRRKRLRYCSCDGCAGYYELYVLLLL